MQDPRRPIPAVIVLGVLAGAAAWISLGHLDAHDGPVGPVRVAMLPPPTWLAACIAAGITIVALLSGRSYGRRPMADGPAPSPADGLLPLAASSLLLLLPFLPWIADALPALLPLAGPGRWIVWFVALGQVAYLLARRRGAGPGPEAPRPLLSGRSNARWAAMVAVAGIVSSGAAAGVRAGGPLYPGGDEPHYLVMAQSLWRDGDLRIENNHDRGDYLEYYRSRLEPHYLTRGIDREIYSVHPIGLPLLAAPIYAVGGYWAVVGLIVIAAAVAGALAWYLCVSQGLPRSAATFAWLATFLSGPFLLNSFAIYPEVLGGLSVLTVFVAATVPAAAPAAAGAGDLVGCARSPRRWGPVRWLWCGLAIGALPWLSSKYAPMAAALALVAAGRIWWRPPRLEISRARAIDTLALLTPFALCLAAWFAFFDVYWGTPWPSAPYGGNSQTHPRYLPAGAPGLLFDQEYGVLTYAPALALALTGLVAMVRHGGAARRLALEVGLVGGALLGTVGAFHIWWGGSSPPGRPVVSAMLLMSIPVAWQHASAGTSPARLALHRLLLLVGLGVAASLLFAREGLLIANGRDGSSELLAWLSPLADLARSAPSFIAQPPLVALTTVALWVASASALGWWVVRRDRPAGPRSFPREGLASALVLVAAAAAFTTAATVAPRLQGFDASAARPLEERWRIGLLDRFDAADLPVAIVYDPWRRVDPASLPARFTLRLHEAAPTANPSPFGRRLSLPAGRYALHVAAPDSTALPAGGTVWIHALRGGPPYTSWTVTDASNLSTTLDLGLDANYLALQLSPELLAARPTVLVTPETIVDASDRLRVGRLAAAVRYGDAAVYFLDREAYPEAPGFWTRGRGTTSIVAAAPAAVRASVAALHLWTHCGPAPNQLTVSTPGSSEVLALAPGDSRDVTVPAPGGRVQVTLSTLDGFIPATIDATSGDSRELGCWIEVREWIR